MPLWIWLHCLFGILFFGVSSLKIATWGASKTDWKNISTSLRNTESWWKLQGEVASLPIWCVFFLKDLLMSDRQRVSRREPVKGKEETPADVAYATLVAVYPEAWGGCHPWGIGEAKFEHHFASIVIVFQMLFNRSVAQSGVQKGKMMQNHRTSKCQYAAYWCHQNFVDIPA